MSDLETWLKQCKERTNAEPRISDEQFTSNFESLALKLGDKATRDPIVLALMRVFAARQDFNAETALTAMVQHLVEDKTRLLEECANYAQRTTYPITAPRSEALR